MSGFSGRKHSNEARRKISAVAQLAKNVEKLARNKRQWEEANPAEAHAAFVRGGFAANHPRFHINKANPCCPFCYPEGVKQ
jgi:hypothetical protein